MAKYSFEEFRQALSDHVKSFQIPTISRTSSHGDYYPMIDYASAIMLLTKIKKEHESFKIITRDYLRAIAKVKAQKEKPMDKQIKKLKSAPNKAIKHLKKDIHESKESIKDDKRLIKTEKKQVAGIKTLLKMDKKSDRKLDKCGIKHK